MTEKTCLYKKLRCCIFSVSPPLLFSGTGNEDSEIFPAGTVFSDSRMYHYNKPKKKKIGLTPYFIYIKQLIKMGKKSMVRWEKEYGHTGKEVLSDLKAFGSRIMRICSGFRKKQNWISITY